MLRYFDKTTVEDSFKRPDKFPTTDSIEAGTFSATIEQYEMLVYLRHELFDDIYLSFDVGATRFVRDTDTRFMIYNGVDIPVSQRSESRTIRETAVTSGYALHYKFNRIWRIDVSRIRASGNDKYQSTQLSLHYTFR